MKALLGRDFVNLPLLCGIAEHSHDASGPPTRGAFGSFFTHGISSFSLRWFTKCQGPASFCICPLLYPTGSAFIALSFSGCVILPAVFSLYRSTWPSPGPLCPGKSLSWPPPHCVLPQASVRTRCRLMASSRNPATFSLSSYTANRACLRLDKKSQNCFMSSCFAEKSQKHSKILYCCYVKYKKTVYIYLVYEGVVNKFTGKVFGGVSWKFCMIYLSYKNRQ